MTNKKKEKQILYYQIAKQAKVVIICLTNKKIERRKDKDKERKYVHNNYSIKEENYVKMKKGQIVQN